MTNVMDKLKNIEHIIAGKSAEQVLKTLSGLTDEKVIFSSSFGYEDQVITHLIFSNNLNVEVFTLDTGRLFSETYSVFSSTINKYDKQIKVYYPNNQALENLVSQKGPLSFYTSTDNRKECCFIRKVEPLKRALAGYTIWITGIRAEQSGNRNDMPMLEWDEANKIIKVHPLINWTLQETKSFVNDNNIPYNVLHDRGFVSIGCQPCTRAIKPGEDFRAGRWWWEDNSKKECGLHSK